MGKSAGPDLAGNGGDLCRQYQVNAAGRRAFRPADDQRDRGEVN
jgi:hypothetical protein